MHLPKALIILLLAATMSGADLPRLSDTPNAEGFAAAWGVDAGSLRYAFRQDRQLRIEQIAGTIPANLAYPGERPRLILQLRNLGAEPLRVAGRWLLVEYSQYTPGSNVFELTMRKLAEHPLGEVSLEIPGRGFVDLPVDVELPARCSAYALLLQRGEGPRLFAAGLARILKPDLRPGGFDYQVTMDHDDPQVVRRLCTPANRIGWQFFASDDPRFAEHYERMTKQLRDYHATGFPTILEFGVGPWDGAYLPLGRHRPHLDAEDTLLDTKSDIVWLPAWDQDFKRLVKRLAIDFGWPKGPINAMKFMNEPWNGMSISGWGADDLRYREVYTVLCEAVEEARAEAGVQILLGGCDSSSNTFDKLFPDGDLSFLPRLDFMSLHYQSLSPSNARFMRDRQGPRGRVRFWDTESWVANSPERVPGVLAGMLAAGHDRVVGIQAHNVVASTVRVEAQVAGGKTELREVMHGWPVAPALAAFQHVIGNRPFRELVFGEALPWVFRFQGDGEEDLALVVCGDLSPALDSNNSVGIVPLRTVRGLAELRDKATLRQRLAALPADHPQRRDLAAALERPQALRGATMTLPSDPRWSLLDGSGNTIPATDGVLVVPLDGSGWYLRPDGSRGAAAALLAAVKAARVTGYEPLASAVRDALKPIGAGAAFAIELKNILNRPISGSLAISIPGLSLSAPERLSFQPWERKLIEIAVTDGAPAPSNQYAFSLRFDAGDDGFVEHDETVRVNLIARRSIAIDGDLSDWQGVLPQAVSAGGGGPTLMETAWLPMVRHDPALGKGFATAWVAADDAGFYIAAKIADDSADEGTFRFADLDEDQFFYPPVSYQVDRAKTTASRTVALRSAAAKRLAPAAEVWEPVASHLELSLDLPGERLVSLYVVDDDQPSLRRTLQVEARDPAGKVLARHEVRNAEAVWLRLRLSGRVTLRMGSNHWLRSSVAAIAVDPVPEGAAAGPVLGEDRESKTAFAGTYGGEALLIPGRPQHGTIPITFSSVLERQKLVWPEDVRRFSYRMRPRLPQGPGSDNLQIAFNVLPDEQKPWYPAAPGTFKGYAGYWCSDYEFAFNEVAARYGGGFEIWPLRLPGKPDKHFYPRQLKYPGQGPVVGGRMAVRRDGGTRIVEAMLPWSAIPHVKQAFDEGRPIKFSYRVNDKGSSGCMELSRDRSVAKRNGSFKPDWVEHWANELLFGWER